MVFFKLKYVVYIIIAYSLLNALIFFISDFFIFQNTKSSYKDNSLGQEIIKLTTQDGKKITGLYLHNPKATFTLLISQGNATDLGDILPGLQDFYQLGFSIFAYDYHGFGTSEGNPTEKNTYQDIDAAYDYLTQVLNISPSKIIIFGRSLGTGPSIDLASRKPSAGVIIESGFLSAFRVFTQIPIFFFDKYTNYRKIKNIHSPILFIHGTQDEMIPLWHSEQLFQLANPPKKFYWINNASHNFYAVIPEAIRKEYFNTIKEFANSFKK